MATITDIETLEALYDAPVPQSLTKVMTRLTPCYRNWIGQAKFCILSTVGPEGTDASPRGDDGPVAHIADDRTIWLPDWRGNNRIDSLRNIVRDPRVSVMFMVAGASNVVRVNGRAVLTNDTNITGHFARNNRQPKLVIAITMDEVYFQCAKAVMRSDLWNGQKPPPDLPKAGQFLKEIDAEFAAKAYDEGYADYAKSRMW